MQGMVVRLGAIENTLRHICDGSFTFTPVAAEPRSHSLPALASLPSYCSPLVWTDVCVNGD
jgi:hypothetical protein